MKVCHESLANKRIRIIKNDEMYKFSKFEQLKSQLRYLSISFRILTKVVPA